MGDFLSQDAIDDLISQIGTGPDDSMGGGGMDDMTGMTGMGGGSVAESRPSVHAIVEAGKDVKTYDFTRASKFSKDQLRTLQMIHETFARLFANTLSAKIRAISKIKVVSVEEVTYEDFINTVNNPSIICVFSMPPMEGSAVMDIGPQIGFPLMDRLLGGSGDDDEDPRELTDIEVNIMESVIEDAFGLLKESWSNVIKINPKLEMLESNPYFVQIVPPGEMIVLINLEAEIGEKSGRMNLAMPYTMLEGVLGKLNIQGWFATSRKSVTPESSRKVEVRLRKTTVDVIAELGTTAVTLRDFLNLEVGDVLQLLQRNTDDIDIYVGNKLKFKGRPGQVGKNIAVQTTSVIKEKENI